MLPNDLLYNNIYVAMSYKNKTLIDSTTQIMS